MISPAVATAAAEPPFRPFFLAAGADAIAGAGIWLLPNVFAALAPVAALPAAVWHRQEILFGMVPAVLAGFLLTALPRWTGQPPVPAPALRMLLALWLAGRIASLASMPAAGALSALFILALALAAARDVARARDRRNAMVVGLVLMFGLGAAAAGGVSDRISTDFGFALSLGAVIGLVMVLGGRIVPSLTAAHLEARGERRPALRFAGIERAAALTSAVALGAWIAAPGAIPTGYACALAACGQVARLVQWRGWTTVRRSSVFALHAAYGWIAVGFALLAIHLLQPETLGRSAAVHAWTIGAVGLMSLSVMASMIRRRSGSAFASSRLVTTACLCIAGACAARLLPELFALAPALWLRLAALAWIAAFSLFLAAFRRILFQRQAAGA